MAYSGAVFYVDDGLVSGTPGSDAVRSTLSGVVFSNPGGTTVRGNKTAHGLTTGAVIDVTATTNGNGAYMITRVDADNFDLDNTSWASFTGADVTGNVVPRGGSSMADAWATVTGGATAARTLSGDVVRLAKSPDPYSLGSAKWTTGPIEATQSITSTTNATPIVVTKNSHGYSDGDWVQITGHSTNNNANGIWKVANSTANTLELQGSVGSGVGGATGTIQRVNCRVVELSTKQNALVDSCDVAWSTLAGPIRTINATPTAGGTGYTVGDILDVTTGGTGGQVRVSTVGGGGAVTALTIYAGGHGTYTTGTGKATSGGTGSGCTVNITSVIGTITVTAFTQPREGSRAANISVPSPTVAIRTRIAYSTLGSTIDYSAYQKISLMVRSSATIASGGVWQVCLCSDTLGKTIVDTFDIPALPASVTNSWVAVSIARTGGGNLGSSIQSVAIYSGSSTAPVAGTSMLFDNIIAHTTAGLNHASLISKASSGNSGYSGDEWWPIQGFSGSRTPGASNENIAVVIDYTPNTQVDSTSARGYWGVSETVTTYARETIKNTLPASASTIINQVPKSGVSLSGGWNASAVQDGMTILDGRGGVGYGIDCTSMTDVNIERVGLVRFNDGVEGVTADRLAVSDCIFSGNVSWNVFASGKLSSIEDSVITCGGAFTTAASLLNVKALSAGPLQGNDLTSCQAHNGPSYGFQQSTVPRMRLVDCESTSCANNSLAISAGTTEAYDCAFATDGSEEITITGAREVDRDFLRCTFGTTVATLVAVADGEIRSQDHNLTGYEYVLFYGGLITSEATDRSGGTGKMWRLATTNTYRDIGTPIRLAVAQIAVAANKLVTVKAWMKKTHATDIGAALVCRGRQIAGVASDVVATKADDTSYEELTITFTPTEDGVVQIEAIAYYVAATSSVVVEDLTITQAA